MSSANCCFSSMQNNSNTCNKSPSQGTDNKDDSAMNDLDDKSGVSNFLSHSKVCLNSRVTGKVSLSQDSNNNNNNDNDFCANKLDEDESDQDPSASSNFSDWQIVDVDAQEQEDQDEQKKENNISTNNEEQQVLFKVSEDIKMKLCCSGKDKPTSILSQTTPRSHTSNDKRVTICNQIELSPLNESVVYKNENLVYICTAIYSLVPIASLVVATSLIYTLLFTRYYYVTLIYATYVYATRERCNKGGSRISAVFNSSFYKYLAAYFDIRLRYPIDMKLDPNRNYLLNYHPHGIAAFGSVCSFATNGIEISSIFPQITTRFLVHESSFKMPLMREVFSSRGDCSVNSKSIDYLLSGKAGTGNLNAIVVGGLAEADLSDDKTLKVVVRERKGFVKKALVHGACLIPCIAFGENSAFKKINFKPNSLMKRLENKWYELFKFKHPVYVGRSFLSNSLPGLMPLKRNITVAMGAPIDVQKVQDPTQEIIDQLHATYIQKLKELYDANKDLCTHYDTSLCIM